MYVCVYVSHHDLYMYVCMQAHQLADAIPVLEELGVYDLERLRLLKDSDVDTLVE